MCTALSMIRLMSESMVNLSTWVSLNMVLHFVSHDKCGRIEEQSETVCSVVVARHVVCLEVLLIFYPQLHFTTSAVMLVDSLSRVITITSDDETDIGSFSRHFNLCYNTL